MNSTMTQNGETSNVNIPAHFEEIRSISTTLSDCKILEYFSRFSGVRVFIIDLISPITNGFFCLPTEAYDNSGLPHMLEHLIFLGSKDYPLKGFLDNYANRCFADGTNAWTGTDHTVYTSSTVGSQGFITLLPILLDHILRPTLRDEDFLTEVHHITGNGSSSGVVFSEMQDDENSYEGLSVFECLNFLYPGNSGFKYNTGGKISDIRKSSNLKVKEFHQKFYKWDNLNIIVAGTINISELLNTIAKVEEHHLGPVSALNFTYDSLINPTNYERPWTKPHNFFPLLESSYSKVYFPSDDEESGHSFISWRALNWKDFFINQAIIVIGDYLTDLNDSPLQKGLVEIDEPYCSDVTLCFQSWKESYFEMTFSDVPFTSECDKESKMNNIFKKTMAILNNILENGFDMTRLKNIIIRSDLSFQLETETNPHTQFSDLIIQYCINGDQKDQLNTVLEFHKITDFLLSKDSYFWLKILQDYFIDAPKVHVHAIPSKKRTKELKDEEEEFKIKQVELFGIEGLKKMEERLKLIKHSQSQPIPNEWFNSIPKLKLEDLQLINFPSYSNFNFQADQDIDFKLRDSLCQLPSPTLINDIPTNFFSITIASRIPNDMPPEHKQLLPLLCDLIFESDVYYDGTLYSYDNYSKHLLNTLVSYDSDVGFYNKDLFPSYVTVNTTFSTENFINGIKTLLAAIKGVKFTKPRIQVTIKILLSSLSEKRRNATSVLNQIEINSRYSQNSFLSCYGFPKQKSILTYYKNNLSEAVDDLTKIYETIFSPENLHFHITTQIKRLPENWLQTFSNIIFPFNRTEFIEFKMFTPPHYPYLDSLASDSELPFGNAILSGLASSDSGHSIYNIKAPHGFNNPLLPALMIICNYFNMTEGPLFRTIRGGGYAYRSSLDYCPCNGEIRLFISPASDIIQAMKKALECINSHLTSSDPFSDYYIESSKSSIIHSLMDREKSAWGFSDQKFVSAFRQTSPNYNYELLLKILNTKNSEIEETFRTTFKLYQDFSPSYNSFKDGRIIIMITNSLMIKESADKMKSLELPELKFFSCDEICSWMANSSKGINKGNESNLNNTKFSDESCQINKSVDDESERDDEDDESEISESEDDEGEYSESEDDEGESNESEDDESESDKRETQEYEDYSNRNYNSDYNKNEDD